MSDEPLNFSGDETDEDADHEMTSLPQWAHEIFESHFEYLLEASQGEVNETKDRELYQKQLGDWMSKLSDEASTPVFLRMRDIILEVAGRQGIVEAKDLPPDVQFTLSELSLSLAGQLIKDVTSRITKELRRLRALERIKFYDQAIEELTLAETYALDSLPPERTGFLKSARSVRAECHRACQALRRHHRQ